jgi:integrase/recombinase XerD
MGEPRSRVSRVCVTGPLVPFADAYATKLRERGYTALTIVNELRQLGHLSRWLEADGLSAGDVTSERLEEFVLARRPTAASNGACSLQGLAPLVDVLAELGVSVPPPPAPEPSLVDGLVAKFRRHLLIERGLAMSTADEYTWRARRFLAAHVGDGDVGRLRAADVTGAVLAASETMSVASVQHFVGALRALLRFCFVEELTDTDLSAAALPMTGRRRSSLPRGISRAAADALLRSCDRRRTIGRRDFAVLLVLLRLGLRAGETASLTLDDIDWRAGEIEVRGKGRRVDRLPLPADVGEAIVAYLQRGRPRTNRRELFLRVLAPVGPLGRGGVSEIVRRACRAAGLPEVGAHRLRHTVATEMLAAGATLPEIGEVLRHHGSSSTAIYARVDIETLRNIARPWPGGEPR